MKLRVRIRYFALYRDLSGRSEELFELNGETTLGDLLAEVRKAHPVLDKQPGQFLLAVNQEYAGHGTVLRDGDEVAIFPSVSGG